MIVKSHRDGTFFVADNGNWRLAGPFPTSEAAWQWIDRHPKDHAEEPENPKQPRMHNRQPRTDESVDKAAVLLVVPLVVADKRSSVKEREFALRMEIKAKRARKLRLTAAQAGWWHRIEKKFGGAA
ncbi:hypothetical protein ACQKKX_02290 [Neorhizobium sp. NPDC001467]|uniref:hypothetical protein n=1 Tax=Neorhizobium sp. NPDC001467 TaxID=3390595 RepID=UPI003D07268B